MRPPERGLLELPQWVLSHPPPPHEVELDLGPEEEGPRKGQASKSRKGEESQRASQGKEGQRASQEETGRRVSGRAKERRVHWE